MTFVIDTVAGRQIVSQNKDALTDQNSPTFILPHLLRVLSAIEQETHHKWRITSYIRASPSHQHGISLDVVPDIAANSASHYAVNNQSDPVLYKRLPLVRALQRVAASYVPSDYTIGIFIEPDHLHIQVFEPDPPGPTIRVVQWKQPKSVYPDTLERMRLPPTSVGYDCSV